MIRKYYEYEGLGGGIDPKSTSKAKTMTQSMTKPFIVANVREITDLLDKEEISYSRMVEMLNEKAAEFYKQEVAKEREKAKKLVEFAERLLHLHACEQEGLSSGKPSFADWMTATNNLQHEIDQYKQSLIEYGQPNSL